MREGHDAGWQSSVDREERYLRALKSTIDKKSKYKLEQACKIGRWITFLPIYQYGTDLFRK